MDVSRGELVLVGLKFCIFLTGEVAGTVFVNAREFAVAYDASLWVVLAQLL